MIRSETKIIICRPKNKILNCRKKTNFTQLFNSPSYYLFLGDTYMILIMSAKYVGDSKKNSLNQTQRISHIFIKKFSIFRNWEDHRNVPSVFSLIQLLQFRENIFAKRNRGRVENILFHIHISCLVASPTSENIFISANVIVALFCIPVARKARRRSYNAKYNR